MKLLTRTTYYYLIISGVLFLAGGTVFYFYISGLLQEEINEQQDIVRDKIIQYVHENNALPLISPVAENKIEFKPVQIQFDEIRSDTTLLSPLLDEQLPYRKVTFPIEAAGQKYAATIYSPMIEKDDLLQTIGKSLGIFTLILVLLLILVNRWLSSRLWKPFYKTVQELKEADVNRTLLFPQSNTTEFNELHLELNRMFTRIQDQYKNLKEFTENASHELQTPLAIIRNNLEWILQSNNLDETDRLKIKETYESTNRLSRLYQSLLLLSKIENRQFSDVRKISVSDLITSKLRTFEEIQEFKHITVSVDIDKLSEIVMDTYLAEVLVSNLIGNAFRYTPEKGTIEINLLGRKLIITNTGPPLTIPTENLFQRFSKENTSLESSGLGLAIVKQICDIYKFTITYGYLSSFHTFTLKF